MSTMMPNYEAGQIVNTRPRYAQAHPNWEGAQGYLESVVTRYLPKLVVTWISGPKEGKTQTIPFYMVVPEGQEELLTMDLGDEEPEEEPDEEGS